VLPGRQRRRFVEQLGPHAARALQGPQGQATGLRARPRAGPGSRGLSTRSRVRRDRNARRPPRADERARRRLPDGEAEARPALPAEGRSRRVQSGLEGGAAAASA